MLEAICQFESFRAHSLHNFGNITSETRVIGGKTYATTYGYDLANRITEIIYPSGRYVDYTYDSSGYLTTVTTKPSAGGGVTTLASSIVHKPFGPIASFTFGNSEAHTRSYDNNYWLTDIDTTYSGTYIQRLDYGHDNAGNLTSITDNIDNTRNETLTVDQLNRLSTASGKYGSRTYTFDNNSGRATRVAGATTYTTTRVTNKNRVDHISDGSSTRNFTWTANGNMATDDRTFVGGGAAAFTYGGRNKMESMTIGGNGITYKVNAFGQRVSEAFSGSTTHYVHDILGNIIAEANGSTGSTTKEYVWMEGELLAQIDSGGNIFYAHNTQVGLPQKMTDVSRTVVWDQIIEPFGEVQSTPTSTTPTAIRFPGQYANANNSLFYNNNRSYDSTGFYPEADPVGLAGGLNPYAYAGQNPTQNVDPSGLLLGPLTPAVPVVATSPAGLIGAALAGAPAAGYLAVRYGGMAVTDALASLIYQGYVALNADSQEQQRFNNDPNRNQNGKLGPGGSPSGLSCPVDDRFKDLQADLEALGGGIPTLAFTKKGATQFIFPNGTVLRFDLAPGQYLSRQGPHINLEYNGTNKHIPLTDK